MKSPAGGWIESPLTPKDGLSSTKRHEGAEKGRVGLSAAQKPW